MIIIVILSFVLSFLFALGGVGSAIVLVPIMYYLGIPLTESKPTGLFINTISLIAATISNIKNKRLDIKMGIPIIVSSFIFAPVGAYATKIIPEKVVIVIFIAFLLFAFFSLMFFRTRKYETKPEYEEKINVIILLIIGSLAGFISGLLGIGGGLFISPILIILKLNPKKVAVLTAFIVPFSSFIGFVTYVYMGYINVGLTVSAGVSAYLGGYLGTKFMHAKLKPTTVKKLLALIVLILAVKMIFEV